MLRLDYVARCQGLLSAFASQPFVGHCLSAVVQRGRGGRHFATWHRYQDARENFLIYARSISTKEKIIMKCN
jgi:hypothetical protein